MPYIYQTCRDVALQKRAREPEPAQPARAALAKLLQPETKAHNTKAQQPHKINSNTNSMLKPTYTYVDVPIHICSQQHTHM